MDLGLMRAATALRAWWWAPRRADQDALQRMLFEVLRVSAAQAEVAAQLARTTEALLAQRDVEGPLPARRPPSGAEWLVEMDES